jgi:hypothetical protein
VTIPADCERNSLTDTLATTEELVAKPLENSSALNHAERMGRSRAELQQHKPASIEYFEMEPQDLSMHDRSASEMRGRLTGVGIPLHDSVAKAYT